MIFHYSNSLTFATMVLGWRSGGGLPSIKVPKGTKLHVEAHFDNPPNNKFNPNANKTVYYGIMTWDEMMFPFFGVVVERDADPTKIISTPFVAN